MQIWQVKMSSSPYEALSPLQTVLCYVSSHSETLLLLLFPETVAFFSDAIMFFLTNVIDLKRLPLKVLAARQPLLCLVSHSNCLLTPQEVKSDSRLKVYNMSVLSVGFMQGKSPIAKHLPFCYRQIEDMPSGLDP